MIGAVKALAKRHWPALRLRTILLLTLLFVASLPGFGALFLRVYENTLVRQTEAELVAQSAALAATTAAIWPGAMPLQTGRGYAPEPTAIDLGETPVLPERPPALAARGRADPGAVAAAGRLAPIAAQTARTTLASIVLVDRAGVVVLGPGAGRRLAGIAELDAALGGRPATALRRNGAYHPRYRLEWLSRASALRIHHARPVVIGGRVAGALLLSRSPRVLFRGLYEDRGKIVLGIGLIFGMLLVLTGLLSRGIARPIEVLGAATRDVAGGWGRIPDAPVTAAIEIRALYADFAMMAAAIERRSRYLRDFATAISHEFKTPLAAIRGAIELIEDHDATMSAADRQRFLANMAADADRLGDLVSRLLDLARADMAQPQPDAATTLDPAVARVTDAFRSPTFTVDVLPLPLQAVAVPETTIKAVLATLLSNSRQAGATRVTISAVLGPSNMILKVADDGPGIAPRDRDRIFVAFYTTRRDAGGTGLGLAIARSLLAANAAGIDLADVPTGTCFLLRLPRCDG